jgi:hypothetical protein
VFASLCVFVLLFVLVCACVRQGGQGGQLVTYQPSPITYHLSFYLLIPVLAPWPAAEDGTSLYGETTKIAEEQIKIAPRKVRRAWILQRKPTFLFDDRHQTWNTKL